MTNKTVVILQPGYLPWLGFFEQLHQSDVFVFYDDVQYDKDGWRNRNRIKTAQGIQWLTVPVITKGLNKPLVKDVLINNNTPWRTKHWESLRQNYSKAPYFKQYSPAFAEIYAREWDRLIDLDTALIYCLAECLGLARQFMFSSQLGIEGGKIDRLVRICEHLGATRFYEGAAGKSYLDEALFQEQHIALEYQNYQHPHYQQLFGEFIPYLSCLDLLFNHGEDSLAILTLSTGGGSHLESPTTR